MERFALFLRKYAPLAAICFASAGLFLIIWLNLTSGSAVQIEGVRFVERPRIDASRIAGQIIDLSKEALLKGTGLAGVRDAALGVPWVKDAAAANTVCGKIIINVMPRRAVASIRRGGKYFPVDADGRVVEDEIDAPIFPVAYGKDSERRAPELVEMLKHYPRVAAHVVGARLVDMARWDLLLFDLESPLVVKLGEEDMRESLFKIVELDVKTGLLWRDVEVIDLRDLDTMLVMKRIGT